MIEFLAILSGMISGLCLLTIAIRKKLPIIGTLASSKLKEAIDSTDKYLVIVSLIFFILCMAFIVIHY